MRKFVCVKCHSFQSYHSQSSVSSTYVTVLPVNRTSKLTSLMSSASYGRVASSKTCGMDRKALVLLLPAPRLALASRQARAGSRLGIGQHLWTGNAACAFAWVASREVSQAPAVCLVELKSPATLCIPDRRNASLGRPCPECRPPVFRVDNLAPECHPCV